MTAINHRSERFAGPMSRPAKPPSFDQLLALIGASKSTVDLAPLLGTAQTFFMGNQRVELEEAITRRTAELPDGEMVS